MYIIGTSREALDVLVGVTAEYFSNVGRTMRFLTDKHAHTMLPEVAILFILSQQLLIEYCRKLSSTHYSRAVLRKCKISNGISRMILSAMALELQTWRRSSMGRFAKL